MTTPNPQAVVVAMERALAAAEHTMEHTHNHNTKLVWETLVGNMQDALPIARQMAKEWDEMVEAKWGLKWLLDYIPEELRNSLRVLPNPAIIKRMLNENETI